jgi:hypothetical protein
LSKLFGQTIQVVTYGKGTKVTPHNSPSLIMLMMHLNDNSGNIVDLPKVSFENVTMGFELKQYGVEYRKISDKTIEGAAKKLVHWYEKNKDGIEEAENSKR